MIVPGGYVVRYQPEGPNEKPGMRMDRLGQGA